MKFLGFDWGKMRCTPSLFLHSLGDVAQAALAGGGSLGGEGSRGDGLRGGLRGFRIVVAKKVCVCVC